MLARVSVDDVPAVFSTIVEAVSDDLQIKPLLGLWDISKLRAEMDCWTERTICKVWLPPPGSRPTEWRLTSTLRTTTAIRYTRSSPPSLDTTTRRSATSCQLFNLSRRQQRLIYYQSGMQPPLRKKAYLKKGAEVKHIVSTYHRCEDNVFHYLDLLAEV